MLHPSGRLFPFMPTQVHVLMDLPFSCGHHGQQIRFIHVGLPIPSRADLHSYALLLHTCVRAGKVGLCRSRSDQCRHISRVSWAVPRRSLSTSTGPCGRQCNCLVAVQVYPPHRPALCGDIVAGECRLPVPERVFHSNAQGRLLQRCVRGGDAVRSRHASTGAHGESTCPRSRNIPSSAERGASSLGMQGRVNAEHMYLGGVCEGCPSKIPSLRFVLVKAFQLGSPLQCTGTEPGGRVRWSGRASLKRHSWSAASMSGVCRGAHPGQLLQRGVGSNVPLSSPAWGVTALPAHLANLCPR